MMAWKSDLLKLFEDIKVCITSSSVLVQYNPSKPIFLKTDWSADGMDWIMMQPDNDKESIDATKLLLETGECNFDITRRGVRLRPTNFGSRSYLLQES